ncbi:hypothetical protein FACS1894172_14080 [Spirochaetia bacterium]|nr:hypothetical protein FACS1894164_13540 [Spirochaetia bacterium]GHU34182.1 hypothetical protein FACS1894172_14080 [Spirochaetia bacterium]
MGKNKLLITTISAGFVLVVAVGAALLVFSAQAKAGDESVSIDTAVNVPSNSGDPNRASTGLTDDGVVKIVVTPPQGAGTSAATVQTSVPAGNQNQATQTGTASQTSVPAGNQDQTAQTGTASQTSVPAGNQNQTAQTGTAPQTSVPAGNQNQTAQTGTASQTSVPSTTQNQTPAARTSTAPATAQTSTTRTVPEESLSNNYWVQAGSFEFQTFAERAKEELKMNGITNTVIEKKVLDSTTWFRLRIGPYNSQQEADRSRDFVRLVKGFEESMTFETTVVAAAAK